MFLPHVVFLMLAIGEANWCIKTSHFLLTLEKSWTKLSLLQFWQYIFIWKSTNRYAYLCMIIEWKGVLDTVLVKFDWLSLCHMLVGCGHELCVRCALYLCSTSNIPSELLGPPGSIPCPLCRHGIVSFARLPGSPENKESKLHLSLGLCTPCMLHPREQERSTPSGSQDIRKNRIVAVSSDLLCPVTCSPFPSVAIPLCTCNDGPCPNFETGESQTQGESPDHSHPTSADAEKMEGVRLEKTTCSSMFWGRRSCSRENQCNAEINA